MKPPSFLIILLVLPLLITLPPATSLDDTLLQKDSPTPPTNETICPKQLPCYKATPFPLLNLYSLIIYAMTSEECDKTSKTKNKLLDNDYFDSLNANPLTNSLTGCWNKDTLVNKWFLGLIILPPILRPPLLDNPLNLNRYPNFLDSLVPLLSVSILHRQSLKPVDANGGGNSSKKNSLKIRLKELGKTQSSSRPLALEFESMIQRSSEGVMLRILFPFLPT